MANMQMNYKSKSVCVVDMGLFVELAIKLSESFGQVYYNSPWQEAFPSSRQTEVGEGLAEVDRIDNIHDIINDVDLFVFPDIYFGETQAYLRGIGKRVFGSGLGDELEIYRDDAKKHFKELGIPQGNYEIIKGMDKLKSFLKNHKDQWVKIDKTRGDSETFKAENYELIEPRLLELEHLLGPKKDEMIFIVEEDLKDTLDLAIDTYCIDGQYPTSALLGMEEKHRRGRFEGHA